MALDKTRQPPSIWATTLAYVTVITLLMAGVIWGVYAVVVVPLTQDLEALREEGDRREAQLEVLLESAEARHRQLDVLVDASLQREMQIDLLIESSVEREEEFAMLSDQLAELLLRISPG